MTTCCACGRLTEAPVPIRDHITPRGTAHTQIACPDCAPHLTPGPLTPDTPPPMPLLPYRNRAPLWPLTPTRAHPTSQNGATP